MQILFILKLGIGIAAMIVPIFLAEASTKSIRGAIVTFNILFVTFGYFLMQFEYLIKKKDNSLLIWFV